jgi:hypothetical protein
MTAEEAMKQIDALLSEYVQSNMSEIRALVRIAKVSADYERDSK